MGKVSLVFKNFADCGVFEKHCSLEHGHFWCGKVAIPIKDVLDKMLLPQEKRQLMKTYTKDGSPISTKKEV